MKIKFTWGHGVVVALLFFMGFILTLIFIADNTGELVSDTYYQDAVKYQEDDINAQKRAHNLVEHPTIKNQANGLSITFPQTMKVDSGSVYLMRPSSKKLDIKEPLKLFNQSFLIHSGKLKSGEYDLKLHWFMNGDNYLIKKTIEWEVP